MLELRRLQAGYGRTEVVRGVSLHVGAGEIVALVGANGAGKTSLMKAVSGLLRPTGGDILWDGAPIHATPIAARVRAAIVHVPEGRQLFAGLSAGGNIRLGGYLAPPEAACPKDAAVAQAAGLFPDIAGRLHESAGTFSGGQQQMIAIARGLMARPRLLLLDEPSLGLSPLLVAAMFRLIAGLRARGIAVLLAEQNARAALAIADRAYVIENGRVALEGTGPGLLANPEMAQRYLGTGQARPVDSAESHRLALRLRALFTDI